MPSPPAPQHLHSLRKKISAIDRELLTLLNQRASLSLEVGKIKEKEGRKNIFHPLREKAILDNLLAANPGPLPGEHLLAIWREIISSSRMLQGPQNVACPGSKYSFAHMGALEYLGHAASYHACTTLEEVFEKVVSSHCELGVVPMENSCQGALSASFDLFMRHDVRIEAEFFLCISHALLSPAPSLAQLHSIYAHTEALRQCTDWLHKNLPRAKHIPVQSTAKAIQLAARRKNAAAIGHIRIAQLNDLKILARHIDNGPESWTRFVIISKKRKKAGLPASIAQSTADKSSLLFTIPNKAGALARVLRLLDAHGVNLCTLESRPLRSQRWEYAFFADVACDLGNPGHAQLLAELAHVCSHLRILGSYPSGPQMHSPDPTRSL
jgi:chorismate mutase/prephenate dehydratase